jgi:hypothetical protein
VLTGLRSASLRTTESLLPALRLDSQPRQQNSEASAEFKSNSERSKDLNRKIIYVSAGMAAVAALAAFFASSAPASGAPAAIAIPVGYRNWTHVKSMLIHDASHPLFASFGGLHHVYANKTAADAMFKKTAKYPDGSILVFDLLESSSKGGAYTEGKRKLLAVMVKDAKQYASTGGWGFEAWNEGTESKRLVHDPAKQCFACHLTRKDADYVYSEWRP